MNDLQPNVTFNSSHVRKIVFSVAACGLILAAIIWGHALWKSRQEWLLGVNARQQNRWEEAALYFQRAILWYAPGNGYVFRAAEDLWRLSVEAEQAGRTEEALNGYRALRGAFYACRSVYVPGREWIDRCNQKIALLMSEQVNPLFSEKVKTKEQRRRDRLALLQAPARPREPWAVAASVGFAGWIIASAGFILQGLNPAGGFQGRRAVLWSSLFFLCYAIWLAGMWLA
ncbi:MAG: hypothetical protein JRG73_16175 [Deltaproteobacteria bacterium]|nr:hypothetical protein [Deltaproteobacteria bacterium]